MISYPVVLCSKYALAKQKLQIGVSVFGARSSFQLLATAKAPYKLLAKHLAAVFLSKGSQSLLLLGYIPVKFSVFSARFSTSSVESWITHPLLLFLLLHRIERRKLHIKMTKKKQLTRNLIEKKIKKITPTEWTLIY